MRASGGSVGVVSERVRERIPPELIRFLADRSPKTLTLRGAPGAGKTTLALAVLDQFDGYRAYVSGRVPRATVLHDHPWVAQAAERPIQVLEFLRFRSEGPPGGLRVGHLRDALQARASDLVDLASVLALPKELAEPLAASGEGGKIVAIDSWEAWVENLLGPTPLALDVPTTRWELERALLDRFREAGAHVLLVVEREERARLDYVTDGALSLSVEEHDGRAERWAFYQKLRGHRLRSISYPFTLDGGRFLCVAPTPFHAPLTPIPDETDPAPAGQGLWPGATAWAGRFGRLPVPGTILLEADAETPARLLWRLFVPAVRATLRGGGRAIVRPPPHLSPREVEEALGALSVVPEPARSLRILIPETSEPMASLPERVLLTVPTSPTGPDTALVHSLETDGFFPTERDAAAGSLLVLFIDSPLDPAASAGELAGPLALADVARRTGRFATAFVARSEHPSIGALRSRSSLHLTIDASRAQFFLTGIRPWTPHLAITLSPPGREATVPYDLVPIV